MMLPQCDNHARESGGMANRLLTKESSVPTVNSADLPAGLQQRAGAYLGERAVDAEVVRLDHNRAAVAPEARPRRARAAQRLRVGHNMLTNGSRVRVCRVCLLRWQCKKWSLRARCEAAFAAQSLTFQKC